MDGPPTNDAPNQAFRPVVPTRAVFHDPRLIRADGCSRFVNRWPVFLSELVVDKVICRNPFIPLGLITDGDKTRLKHGALTNRSPS